MAAYTPTVWVNNVPPPMSAANLNKLTNELELQASDQGIAHSLPNWVDGAAPAITDAAPLNEMERIVQNVAESVGLSYTPTVWSSGWTPARNATRLNRLEVQAQANRAAIDSEPVPPTGLPYAEAALRPGYVTLTTANIPLGTEDYTLPTTADYLIDLGWIVRDRKLKIYTRPGQRVHTKNAHFNISLPATSSTTVGNAYSRSGFGYRPVSASAAPADHLSLTGCLITGPWMADGLTFGDSGSSAVNANKVTYQNVRVESSSYYRGAQNSWDTGEHYDAFHMQGPLGTIEFGNCTFYACDVISPGHGGKGFMLNAYSARPNGYTVNMNRVNFWGDGARTGSFINQDYANIVLNMTDVYALKEGSGAYVWASGSFLFFMGSRDALANNWTSSGIAPSRVASFPSGSGFNGQIREGRSPDGLDFCTRADLGLPELA